MTFDEISAEVKKKKTSNFFKRMKWKKKPEILEYDSKEKVFW